MRKSLFIPISILAAALLLIFFFRPWIMPNTYVNGWGAMSKKSESVNSTQHIQFNATILNDGHYPVYVTQVETIFSESIQNNFESGNDKIPVHKWLKPNETTEISGEWVFSTSGIRDNNIMSVPHYASFKVHLFPF